MADYITPDELRAYIGSDTSNWSSVIQTACTVASRAVENITGRVFLDSGAVSVLHYAPSDLWCVETDDFSTLTGLIVQTDTGYDNTYATTLTVNTDFIVQPRDQVRGGQPWPYTKLVIAPRSRQYFPAPYLGQQETVKVTARWGWASVPDPIKRACLIAAKRLFDLKDAGATGTMGLDGWGPVKIRENPEVRALCDPYAYSPVTVV